MNVDVFVKCFGKNVIGMEEQKVMGKQLRQPPLLSVTYTLKLLDDILDRHN